MYFDNLRLKADNGECAERIGSIGVTKRGRRPRVGRGPIVDFIALIVDFIALIVERIALIVEFIPLVCALMPQLTQTARELGALWRPGY